MTRTAFLLCFFLAIAGIQPATPADAAITEGARLAAVYDQILAARFLLAETELKQTCPPAPEEACQVLRVVSLWWQILLDPASRRLDGALNARAAAAIAACEAWTGREPRRAEAWFYLAGSYAPLVQWRVLRGERLAAAREGSKIKGALERALALDPTLNDAYFGVGLYRYYADVAPAGAKILRWLLLLPGGDRVQGMQEMLRARERGELLTGEADYQLHVLYLWYEHKPSEALELLSALDARYPTNPLFLQRIAEVERTYFHDHPASADAWQRLLDRANAGRVSEPQLAEVVARLGLAHELDAMFETDRALDHLSIVIAQHPSAPAGADGEAQALFAAASARLRDEAYRLSLEGWRALERGDATRAVERLARAVTLAPNDSVARYRYARALGASGDADAARAELARVVGARAVPAIVRASALVDYAQTLERAGDRARALTIYRDAARIVGGDPRAHDQATRAIKRLTSPSDHRPTLFDFFCTLCLTSEYSEP